MSKDAKQILGEVRAERSRLESEAETALTEAVSQIAEANARLTRAESLKKVEAALKARHRPAPPRRQS